MITEDKRAEIRREAIRCLGEAEMRGMSEAAAICECIADRISGEGELNRRQRRTARRCAAAIREQAARKLAETM